MHGEEENKAFADFAAPTETQKAAKLPTLERGRTFLTSSSRPGRLAAQAGGRRAPPPPKARADPPPTDNNGPTAEGRRRKGTPRKREACGGTHRRQPTTAARRKAGDGRAALAEGGERRAPRARLRARRAAIKNGGGTPRPLCPKGAQLANRRTQDGREEEGKGKSRGGPTINLSRHNSHCACKGGKKGGAQLPDFFPPLQHN